MQEALDSIPSTADFLKSCLNKMLITQLKLSPEINSIGHMTPFLSIGFSFCTLVSFNSGLLVQVGS